MKQGSEEGEVKGIGASGEGSGLRASDCKEELQLSLNGILFGRANQRSVKEQKGVKKNGGSKSDLVWL